MTTETKEEYQTLVERTEATLEKYRERAEELRGVLGDARAATKVQIKAMISRLEKKHESASDRLSRLRRGGTTNTEEIGQLHQQIVSELTDMKRTIDRRIM